MIPEAKLGIRERIEYRAACKLADGKPWTGLLRRTAENAIWDAEWIPAEWKASDIHVETRSVSESDWERWSE